MTEALLFFLTVFTVASAPSDDRAIAAMDTGSPLGAQPRENETPEERIARIKARFGVRSFRVSKVRCFPAVCQKQCKTRASPTEEGDLIAVEPETVADPPKSDRLACNRATTETAGRSMKMADASGPSS
jgi:hypothetical protein